MQHLRASQNSLMGRNKTNPKRLGRGERGPPTVVGDLPMLHCRMWVRALTTWAFSSHLPHLFCR